MVRTIHKMVEAEDHRALDELWRVLGGSQPPLGSADAKGALLVELVHSLCGKGSVYAAERGALDRLGSTIGLEPSDYGSVEYLEDAIVERLSKVLQERLSAMSEEERREFYANMVRRISDEDRIRLLDQLLGDFDQMTEAQKRDFIREVAHEFDIPANEVLEAVKGGAAGLITLLAANEAGFAIFLWTTRIMYIAGSAVGVTIPFALYESKNVLLGWLLGPIGMLVTTAMTAGWFGAKAWRRKERFRKLVQVAAHTSAWRRRKASA